MTVIYDAPRNTSAGRQQQLDSLPSVIQEDEQIKLSAEYMQTLPEEDRKLAKAVLLCICYSANVGGTGTLTGTVPNVIALGQLQGFAKLRGETTELTYASWMACQVPAMILILILTWLWLQLLYFGPRKLCHRNKNPGVQTILRQKYRQLGSMTFGEYSVMFLFAILVGLWVFREPRFMPGWGQFFKKGFVKDAVPAVLIGCAMFILPRELPDFLCFRGRDPRKNPILRKSLLTWKSMERFPWNVILILGGGFAMAEGVSKSGLSDLIGNTLKSGLHNVHPALFCFICVAVVTFLTEVTSNTSTATVFIPILLGVAAGIGVNPMYFVLPVAVACSFAFMLPVATPPNAIVFGAGVLRVLDMDIPAPDPNIDPGPDTGSRYG